MDLASEFVEGLQVLNLGQNVLEKLRLLFHRLGFPFRKRGWDEAHSCWIHFRVN